jgi:hypothetical protein
MQAMPAQAQTRVFVAAQGSDANPCTFALPCRSFQHAHDTVAAGGEIDVLDPAGYGAVTITKAISIQGHGFSGVSVPSGGTGIAIDAASTDAINLDGLLIEGGGVGANGIAFSSGRSLVVENCVVRKVTVEGLLVLSHSTTLQTVSVAHSLFTDAGDAGIAILSQSSGAITVAINRVGLYNNLVAGLAVNGTFGTGAINVAVTDSVAANNAAAGNASGFLVKSTTGHSVSNLVLTRATAVGNDAGVLARGANATLWLAHSTITGNTAGYFAGTGGIILSYGDNYIDDNADNVGTLGSATQQ